MEERVFKPDIQIAFNRKARHDYIILDTFEAGLVLQGTEIKSIRAHRVNLKDCYARIKNGEVWLENCHISSYEATNLWGGHQPTRPRKLLLHKAQIRKLQAQIKEKGLTLTALKLYIKNGRHAKIELALVKGKNQGDKREALKRAEANREMARHLRSRS